MPPITLTLTLEQTNTILEALGQLPYARVYELVETVCQQARPQVEQAQVESPTPGAAPNLTVARPA